MQQVDTRCLVEAPRSSDLPKKVRYLLVRARTSPQIVRWTFVLFVFTMPFEAMNLGAISGIASLPRLAGLLFFSTCLFYWKVCFRRPLPAVWWFAGYVFVFGLNGVFIPEPFISEFNVRRQTLIQLLVLCWIGSTLLQEEKLTRHIVLAFSIATLLTAIGMLLGLPGFAEAIGGGRFTVAGLNADGAGSLMALGAHALLGLGVGSEQMRRKRWMRVTCLAMALLPLMAMVYTGTRGGVVAFLAGSLLYITSNYSSRQKKVAIVGVTIAVVCVVYLVINYPGIWSRFEKSYDTGDSSGRDRIYRASLEMIAEKPLLGWRPIVLAYELGPRAKVGRQAGWGQQDPHNLLFYLLLEGGLLGATPFLIGLGLCVRAAWTARVGSLGLFPLVLLWTTLVSGMFGTPLHTKLLWLIFAISLASGASTVKQHKSKNLIIRTILHTTKPPKETLRHYKLDS
jgi:O-antigen ligase